jgi:hypothetical protein
MFDSSVVLDLTFIRELAAPLKQTSSLPRRLRLACYTTGPFLASNSALYS